VSRLTPKRFGFVSDAAEREYKDLPSEIQDEFGKELRRIQFGEDPTIPITHLNGGGMGGVVELKINGSPAYRCVYVAKYADSVIVLHSFEKTTNQTDRQAMVVIKQRLRELLAEVK